MFEVACSAGVSPEVYWYGDPAWTWVKIRLWEKEQRLKWKREDENNYQLGIYVLKAIAACLDKDSQYPEEPLFYVPTPEEKQAKLEADIDRAFGVTRNN